jgi:hypothetical protein
LRGGIEGWTAGGPKGDKWSRRHLSSLGNVHLHLKGISALRQWKKGYKTPLPTLTHGITSFWVPLHSPICSLSLLFSTNKIFLTSAIDCMYVYLQSPHTETLTNLTGMVHGRESGHKGRALMNGIGYLIRTGQRGCELAFCHVRMLWKYCQMRNQATLREVGELGLFILHWWSQMS